MSDCWSVMKRRCFINFIAHSPRGSVFLQSVEISKERKTGHFLSQLSSRVIDMVGPCHVVQFISDNASNFEVAGDMLVGKYPTMYKTKCAAHGIQLLFKDIYEQVTWLQSVVDHAKSIQSYMYKHTIITALMRKVTNGRELKKPCATRFASNFLVVQSLLTLENELRLFVASSKWRDLSYSKSRDAKFVTELIQDTSFWSDGREVIQVLEPLVWILRLVDGEGSTTGYLFQAMEMARAGLQKKVDENGERYGRIVTLFDKRRRDNIMHLIHAFAASLDPVYMTSSSFRQTSIVKEGLYYLFEHVVHKDDEDQFMRDYRDYLMKLASLFNAATSNMMKTYHPRLWWEFCGDDLHVLQKYAIRVLSQPCSSSSCERNWSAFEAAKTKKRNRLTPYMLGLLFYCRMNTMMMHNIGDKLLKDADPIDLSSLNEWPDYGEELEVQVEQSPPSLIEEIGNTFGLGTTSSPLDGTNTSVGSNSSTSLTELTNVCVTCIDDEDDDGDMFVDFEDYGD